MMKAIMPNAVTLPVTMLGISAGSPIFSFSPAKTERVQRMRILWLVL
jgi:hypothetical protein